MDLHSKLTTYITSTMTSPVTKTAKTSKWLRLKSQNLYEIRETLGKFIYFLDNSFHVGNQCSISICSAKNSCISGFQKPPSNKI